MKNVKLGKTGLTVPSIVVGCMRFSGKSNEQMNHFIHHAIENGAYYFDHADIYGDGKCEEIFGNAWSGDSSLKREDMIIQTKCGINNNAEQSHYNMSKDYILNAVDNSLKRLKTDYIDVLLLHRPDALTDPQEVAEAFEILEKAGKVKNFGVSNHKPMQIELLKKCIKQELVANQLQFGLAVSNMIANGMEVNMTSDGAIDRDGSVLDYSRLNDITIQAWSPFQMPEWKGIFFGNREYKKLNKTLEEIAKKYDSTPTAIATAWITRHPANMQVIAGTTSEERLTEIISGSDIVLNHEEWYKLYLAAGHPLP